MPYSKIHLKCIPSIPSCAVRAKGQCSNPSNVGQPANNNNSATGLAVHNVCVVYGLIVQVLGGSC